MNIPWSVVAGASLIGIIVGFKWQLKGVIIFIVLWTALASYATYFL